MTDYEEYDDQVLTRVEDIRNTMGNSFEEIFKGHYRVATNSIMDGDRDRRSLKRANTALRVLETELSLWMTKEELEEIRSIRRSLKIIKPFSPDDKESYKDLLYERLEIIIVVMGRKGLLPPKDLELEG